MTAGDIQAGDGRTTSITTTQLLMLFSLLVANKREEKRHTLLLTFSGCPPLQALSLSVHRTRVDAAKMWRRVLLEEKKQQTCR